MNRYPFWKYAIIVIALLLGVVYTLPNFFGEAPAVQVSPGRSSAKVDLDTQGKVEDALKAAGLTLTRSTLWQLAALEQHTTPQALGEAEKAALLEAVRTHPPVAVFPPQAEMEAKTMSKEMTGAEMDNERRFRFGLTEDLQ